MGTFTQPVEVHDVLHQPEQMHSGSASAGGTGAPAAPAKAAAAGAGGQTGPQYWYTRAYRALKQRASEPMQLMREYQHICALDYSIAHSSSVAKSKAAAGRNRYSNVLPYDHNRVVLQQPRAPYINASVVQLQPPLLPQPCSYIATQGPLPSTTADFWAMVVELSVPAVLMLTNNSEGGMVKCSQYFPHSLGSVSRVGGYEIKVTAEEPFGPDCTRRTLQVSSSSDPSSAATPTPTTRSHSLCHYHFHAWPDHGTPQRSSTIRDLCRALEGARATGHPVLVHCSAGIGRTGTFCAIDILLQRLDAWASCHNGAGPDRAEVEEALDLPKLVHQLRAQRMGMVQTIEQYVFVYKALLDDQTERVKANPNSGNNGGSSDDSAPAAGGGSSGGGGGRSSGSSGSDVQLGSAGVC